MAKARQVEIAKYKSRITELESELRFSRVRCARILAVLRSYPKGITEVKDASVHLELEGDPEDD